MRTIDGDKLIEWIEEQKNSPASGMHGIVCGTFDDVKAKILSLSSNIKENIHYPFNTEKEWLDYNNNLYKVFRASTDTSEKKEKPTMSKSIEDCKNEVARNTYKRKNWDDLTNSEMETAIDIAIILYHTRQLEEAAKEFPSAEEINDWVITSEYNPFSTDRIAGREEGALHMKQQATLLFSSQKSEIERMRKAFKQVTGMSDNGINEYIESTKI